MNKRRDFTQGSIFKHIIALSVPTILSFALQTSFNIIDTIFVGRLGADAIAAVSMVFPFVILIIALGSGLGIGAASLVARYLGANKTGEASKVVEHVMLIAIVLSAFFALAGHFFSEFMFSLIGATPEVLSLAMTYSKWIFGFGGLIFIFISFSNILRGEGDAKTPMKYMILSVLLNLILDPLLIFGIWFFPAMGIEGAALATIIARGVACILLLNHIISGKSAMELAFKKFRYSFDIIKRIFSVGVPASISIILISIGMICITRIVASFGSEAIAAYGIGWKIESIVFYSAISISLACLALVGHNFGAGNIERAKRAAWAAAGFAMGLTLVVSVIILLTQKFWLGIFTDNDLVLSHTMNYIKVLALFFAFTNVSMVIESAFQGFGRGMPKFLLTFLRVGVFAIPLAYILSKSFGLIGVWYGLAVSNVLGALIAVVWFRFSTFKKDLN